MSDPVPFIVIHLPGAPRGKGRPRFGTAGGFVRVWTDKKTKAYEDELADVARDQMGLMPPRETAVTVKIEAATAIPPSWSRKKRAAALAGDLTPTGKPDFDNISKIASDALNKIVWKDDSLIIASYFRKFYSETPGLRISVWDWE